MHCENPNGDLKSVLKIEKPSKRVARGDKLKVCVDLEKQTLDNWCDGPGLRFFVGGIKLVEAKSDF